VRVWDPEQGEQWTLRGHRAEVPWVVFGDGGVLLSLSVDGTAPRVAPGRRAARVLAGHQGAVDAVRFAPRLATVGQDATLRVWDPPPAPTFAFEHPAPVRYVEIGGRWAITSDAAHTCRLWDLGAGTAPGAGRARRLHRRRGLRSRGARASPSWPAAAS
jgi:WD40 repeat protein